MFLIAQQEKISKILRQHKDAERKLGAEIHPAARTQSLTQEGRADDERKSFNSNLILAINSHSMQRT